MPKRHKSNYYLPASKRLKIHRHQTEAALLERTIAIHNDALQHKQDQDTPAEMKRMIREEEEGNTSENDTPSDEGEEEDIRSDNEDEELSKKSKDKKHSKQQKKQKIKPRITRVDQTKVKSTGKSVEEIAHKYIGRILNVMKDYQLEMNSMVSKDGIRLLISDEEYYDVPPDLYTRIMKKKNSVGPLGLELLQLMGEPTKYGSLGDYKGLERWNDKKFNAAVALLKKHRPDISKDLIRKRISNQAQNLRRCKENTKSSKSSTSKKASVTTKKSTSITAKKRKEPPTSSETGNSKKKKTD